MDDIALKISNALGVNDLRNRGASMIKDFEDRIAKQDQEIKELRKENAKLIEANANGECLNCIKLRKTLVEFEEALEGDLNIDNLLKVIEDQKSQIKDMNESLGEMKTKLTAFEETKLKLTSARNENFGLRKDIRSLQREVEQMKTHAGQDPDSGFDDETEKRRALASPIDTCSGCSNLRTRHSTLCDVNNKLIDALVKYEDMTVTLKVTGDRLWGHQFRRVMRMMTDLNNPSLQTDTFTMIWDERILPKLDTLKRKIEEKMEAGEIHSMVSQAARYRRPSSSSECSESAVRKEPSVAVKRKLSSSSECSEPAAKKTVKTEPLLEEERPDSRHSVESQDLRAATPLSQASTIVTTSVEPGAPCQDERLDDADGPADQQAETSPYRIKPTVLQKIQEDTYRVVRSMGIDVSELTGQGQVQSNCTSWAGIRAKENFLGQKWVSLMGMKSPLIEKEVKNQEDTDKLKEIERVEASLNKQWSDLQEAKKRMPRPSEQDHGASRPSSNVISSGRSSSSYVVSTVNRETSSVSREIPPLIKDVPFSIGPFYQVTPSVSSALSRETSSISPVMRDVSPVMRDVGLPPSFSRETSSISPVMRDVSPVMRDVSSAMRDVVRPPSISSETSSISPVMRDVSPVMRDALPPSISRETSAISQAMPNAQSSSSQGTSSIPIFQQRHGPVHHRPTGSPTLEQPPQTQLQQRPSGLQLSQMLRGTVEPLSAGHTWQIWNNFLDGSSRPQGRQQVPQAHNSRQQARNQPQQSHNQPQQSRNQPQQVHNHPQHVQHNPSLSAHSARQPAHFNPLQQAHTHLQQAHNPHQPAHNPPQQAHNPLLQVHNPRQQAHNLPQQAHNPQQQAHNPLPQVQRALNLLQQTHHNHQQQAHYPMGPPPPPPQTPATMELYQNTFNVTRK